MWTDIQTDRQTDILITKLRTPPASQGRSNIGLFTVGTRDLQHRRRLLSWTKFYGLLALTVTPKPSLNHRTGYSMDSQLYLVAD